MSIETYTAVFFRKNWIEEKIKISRRKLAFNQIKPVQVQLEKYYTTKQRHTKSTNGDQMQNPAVKT